ncbi:MAG: DNA-directed RNA polymerase subunit beta, partial [Candidatus Brocadiales bacterium]|nr:DNA-directed RNA polymerase subunit beta [Candidatus Bathyanammoxibius sp.]
MEVRDYGKTKNLVEIPNLTSIQTDAYGGFLQADVPASRRKSKGLEAILKEIFPIKSYDDLVSLEYVKYELSKARYSPEECRQLRLTYGRPLRLRLRLTFKERGECVEEDVYVGEMPIMIGGGEFIINGTERVIVTQLHRSPGVDFLEEVQTEKRRHSCRIIPERGSWVEIEVGKKDVLNVRIDQSGRFPATCFLRAMGEEFSRNEDIIRLFYETETVRLTNPAKLKQNYSAQTVFDPKTGEVVLKAGVLITEGIIDDLAKLGQKELEIVKTAEDLLVLSSLQDDKTGSHEEALLKLYVRFRPGNPPHLDKAKQLFYEKFFDPKRYRLGSVGRFRLNRKFNQDIGANEMTLQKDDIVNSIKYIIKLRKGGGAVVDDIDHLGNRRLRTIDELVGEELRRGFLKLRRTVQERMSGKELDQLTPRVLINSKTIMSTIDYFFSRGELSQVLDQTNPLAQLTHERRLSALGPGGLNRKRAGFEVRDVHISHYGRICPIETPEGTNIGLIASLSIYATVDPYGFLVTPYQKVRNGKPTGNVEYLRADEEEGKYLVPMDAMAASNGKRGQLTDEVLTRYNGDFYMTESSKINYIDVSPKQLVGVSASLIPFLEHSDANRALMGSNMQRQAVPLLKTAPPIVATGMEKVVAQNSSMVICARKSGVVTAVDAEHIVIDDHDEYHLRKFVGSNEGTCLNQRPIVREGQSVKKGQVIADGAATSGGELSLGCDVLVAFLVWDGYNFEDAIVVSEKLLKDDMFTSIHREDFEAEVRETKLGREEFTRDIPSVSEKALKNLDEHGVVLGGTKVGPGDILVGKIAPKSRGELSPEEKLLYAIFGRAGEDVRNESLEVPSGIEGTVLGTQGFSRRAYLSEQERKKINQQISDTEQKYGREISREFIAMVQAIQKETRKPLVDTQTLQEFVVRVGMPSKRVLELEEAFNVENIKFSSKEARSAAIATSKPSIDKIESLKDERDRKINQLKRGDELPSGVLEVAKVSLATRRRLSVGDKMAGRHGNKGVIAKVLPEEDMPFLEDGTPVQVLLNPLGVPSRMNVGQILETHLGWAAKHLGFQAVTPVFEGAKESEIKATLKEAGLQEDGKVTMYDGRTGEPFEQKVTVGYMYMMKLHHLVDDKVHARATGPYSLITQQPLGGKARFG